MPYPVNVLKSKSRVALSWSCHTFIIHPSQQTVSSHDTVTPSHDTVTPSHDTVTPLYDTVTPSYDTVTPLYDTATPSPTQSVSAAERGWEAAQTAAPSLFPAKLVTRRKDIRGRRRRRRRRRHASRGGDVPAARHLAPSRHVTRHATSTHPSRHATWPPHVTSCHAAETRRRVEPSGRGQTSIPLIAMVSTAVPKAGLPNARGNHTPAEVKWRPPDGRLKLAHCACAELAHIHCSALFWLCFRLRLRLRLWFRLWFRRGSGSSSTPAGLAPGFGFGSGSDSGSDSGSGRGFGSSSTPVRLALDSGSGFGSDSRLSSASVQPRFRLGPCAHSTAHVPTATPNSDATAGRCLGPLE